MTTMTLTTTSISLNVGCDHTECAELAFPLFKQLHDGNYDRCSVMPIPSSVEEWRAAHRTARKRADRAERRGYIAKPIRREERADEIYAINTSAAERQGRPMTSGYSQRPSETPPPNYPCLRHAVRSYGVTTPAGVLVAYLTVYRCGQLVLVSQILGHADHLDAEVMYLLWQQMVEAESFDTDGFIVYNLWSSGTDGLRFYKERVGLAPVDVRWTT